MWNSVKQKDPLLALHILSDLGHRSLNKVKLLNCKAEKLTTLQCWFYFPFSVPPFPLHLSHLPNVPLSITRVTWFRDQHLNRPLKGFRCTLKQEKSGSRSPYSIWFLLVAFLLITFPGESHIHTFSQQQSLQSWGPPMPKDNEEMPPREVTKEWRNAVRGNSNIHILYQLLSLISCVI